MASCHLLLSRNSSLELVAIKDAPALQSNADDQLVCCWLECLAFSSWKLKCSLPLPETTMLYLLLYLECPCVGSYSVPLITSDKKILNSVLCHLYLKRPWMALVKVFNRLQ